MVIVDTPGGVWGLIAKVTMLVPAVWLRLKNAVTPGGSPSAESPTLPAKLLNPWPETWNGIRWKSVQGQGS